ncbi:unnamed protein product [Adineta steineri]|uniref:Uncharacterized protein n=2 Tax=Adineta steineri TaxID=433720 RepID=A0A814JE94_9BILA|nr:unnamed protein product [Adineta steineri]CAF0968092.1 unnamed protein product [Adineta steineri]CAF1004123.1 unnamed protein product [Adineta steineri]CAF1036270.1 unnamed protein product [Adineta steineri]CAF1049656.1 unnamed protein product [Adineta steineri]
MTRWIIEQQMTGITDTMRINILSTISTSIDIHGTSSMYKIAEELKTWLNGTYEKYWTVVIGDPNRFVSCGTISEAKYLCIKESRLGWRIQMYKQLG